ncbi:MAG: HNH endonuclease [Vannielia sp.]|uniref:HNH endonuclease signature motif containing protein n=1 Tax=Vannielia sp. TaxID=2813045 RepID=UPI003B8E6DD8
MANRPLPSPEVLRQLLSYDPEAGALQWQERPEHFFQTEDPRGRGWLCSQWNSRNAGKEALTNTNGDGYKQGRIFGVTVKAHRVIWAMTYGAWPEDQVDHINGNRDDNRLVNLRASTNSQNQRNRKVGSNNKSGHLGVSELKCGSWLAFITNNGHRVSLGQFQTKEEAAAARKAAEKCLGFSEGHGRRALAGEAE